MLKDIKAALKHWFTVFILRGYGWRPRRTIYLGKSELQWCNPFSSVWMTEKVAVKMLRVQMMDEYRHR